MFGYIVPSLLPLSPQLLIEKKVCVVHKKYSGVRRDTCGSPRRGAGSNCKNTLLSVSSTSIIAA